MLAATFPGAILMTPSTRRARWLAACLVLGAAVSTAQDTTPPGDPELARILREHAEAVGRLEERYRQAREGRLGETLARLRELQDEHCRAARLDEAVAVRDTIRHLSGAPAAPAQPMVHAPFAPEFAPEKLAALAVQPGQSLQFTVTGSPQGPVWGTDVYTIDSRLAAAAVHAGVLAPGETGVVTVRIVASPDEHPASVRHGVASGRWGRYRASYRVERALAAPVTLPREPGLPAVPPPPPAPAPPVVPSPPLPPLPVPPPPAAERALPAEEPAPAAEAPRAVRRPFD